MIDVAVPYLSLVGSSYVVIISSVTYGVYAVSTLCGPTDPLTRSLHNDRWPLTYWTRLFVLPWTLLLSRIQAFETSLASLGTVSLALSWSWPYIRSWMLEEDPQPAVGPFFGSSAGTLSLSELWSVRQRWVWGWWVVKRYYAQFYRHMVLPLIVGQRRHPLSDGRHDEGSESRRRTHHSTPSTATTTTTTTLSSTSTTSNTNANNSTTETAVWDTALTDYADYDVYFGDDQPSSLTSTRISAYDLLQHVVGTWMLPALSATTGHLLQQWVAPKITSVSLDTFGWSMVGGCVLAVVKVSLDLLVSSLRLTMIGFGKGRLSSPTASIAVADAGSELPTVVLKEINGQSDEIFFLH